MSDYDMSIHQNPDAQAWAKFFIKTHPDTPHDEATMIGWFANAMMAMHDHLTGQTVLNGDHAQYLIDQQSQEEAKDTITQIDMNVLVKEWIAACDAALNWADANARWFDISTAPLNGGSSAKFQILYKGGHFEDAWSYAGKIWVADQDGCDCQVSLGDATHWRPIQNPPLGQLPAPLERLGEVLRKVKGAHG